MNWHTEAARNVACDGAIGKDVTGFFFLFFQGQLDFKMFLLIFLKYM